MRLFIVAVVAALVSVLVVYLWAVWVRSGWRWRQLSTREREKCSRASLMFADAERQRSRRRRASRAMRSRAGADWTAGK